jgi:hypothetical protein
MGKNQVKPEPEKPQSYTIDLLLREIQYKKDSLQYDYETLKRTQETINKQEKAIAKIEETVAILQGMRQK